MRDEGLVLLILDHARNANRVVGVTFTQYPYNRPMPLGYMQGGGYLLSMPLVEAIVQQIRCGCGGCGSVGRYVQVTQPVVDLPCVGWFTC